MFLMSIQAFVLCFTTSLLGAPTPVAGPVDVEGVILDVAWLPEEEIKGMMVTGTAGHDRAIPARFRVSLGNYSGIDSDTFEIMKSFYKWSVPDHHNSAEMPKFIVVQLYHPDKTFLKKGMRIRVKGYRLWGDEGGDYPAYIEFQILPTKIREDKGRPSNSRAIVQTTNLTIIRLRLIIRIVISLIIVPAIIPIIRKNTVYELIRDFSCSVSHLKLNCGE